MTEKKFVVYRGTRMIEGWPERIQEAQKVATVVVDGKEHNRVRYGDESEDWGADRGPCHDCGVIKGEFHVPSCDAERCPACGGQAIGCDCDYESSGDASTSSRLQ